MTNRRLIGIDPGKSGGIAWWSAVVGMCATPMPKTRFDLWEKIQELSPHADFAYIEKVHAQPGQGVTSMFSFGENKGGLLMALTAAGIAHEEVTPQKWQKELGLIRTNKNESTTDKKNRHKQKAKDLFPDRKITHAIADAVLIAEYCRRVRKEMQ